MSFDPDGPVKGETVGEWIARVKLEVEAREAKIDQMIVSYDSVASRLATTEALLVNLVNEVIELQRFTGVSQLGGAERKGLSEAIREGHLGKRLLRKLRDSLNEKDYVDPKFSGGMAELHTCNVMAQNYDPRLVDETELRPSGGLNEE